MLFLLIIQIRFDRKAKLRGTHSISVGEFSAFMTILKAIKEFENWKTINTGKATIYYYDRHLKYFCLFLRDPQYDIEKIKLKDIILFVNLSKEIGWGDSNVQEKTVVIRNFFEYYYKRGRNVVNPELIPVPRTRDKIPKVANIKDYKKIIKMLEEDKRMQGIRNLAIIKMYYDTAIRRNELLSLNVSDVKERTCKIETEKAKRFCHRQIFWSMDTQKSIDKWLKVRSGLLPLIKDKEALFVCLDGNKFGERLGKGGINEMLRRLSKKIGIPTLNPHSLRHLFGKDCAEKNLNNSNISTLMGHTNLNYSLRYTRLYGKELHKQHTKVRAI